MEKIAKFLSGRVGAPVTLLLGLIFAGLAFGPLAAEKSDGAPGVGLPSNNETVLVDNALADLPGQDGSAAVIIYRTVDGGTLSAEDTKWLVGEVDPMSPVPMPVGGANELFTEWSNVEVNGTAIVPPVTISEDKTAAIVTVPMDKLEEVKEQSARVADMRETMTKGMPSTLEAKLTGPEGFLADISNVFAGADFALLGTTALVVMVLLLITYRSPSLWLIPLLIVGTADGMAGGLATRVAGWFDVTLVASITGILLTLRVTSLVLIACDACVVGASGSGKSTPSTAHPSSSLVMVSTTAPATLLPKLRRSHEPCSRLNDCQSTSAASVKAAADAMTMCWALGLRA